MREPVQGFKRAWQRVKVIGEGSEARRKPTAHLEAECRAALRSIDLHFHDLRREAGSRWLDAGVPLHRIQKWLGHANISQTSTYLMAESADDDEAMRRFEARQAELQTFATESKTGGFNQAQSATIADSESQLSSIKPH
jgi:integrase